MTGSAPFTILCLASYEKGAEFMREAKRQGGRVLLLTAEKLAQANWPRESIDEVYLVPDPYHETNVIHAVSYLARTETLDRIVALDDYDVEMGAILREHLRLPGMGESQVRFYRDKLAMRMRAKEASIRVPEFVSIFNYDRLREFMGRVAPPWLLKPRSEASSMGIKRIDEPEQLWRRLDILGDRQSFFLLEQYIPGEIFHVDSIVVDRQVVFVEVHQYGRPPMDVFQGGGIFTTHTVLRDSADARALHIFNQDLVQAMGLVRGATHSEFIKSSATGEFYFLENAARVGGANIVELVEAATGVNLWVEWARVECGAPGAAYHAPPRRQDYAGVIITLARQEEPDMAAYQDPEIVWRMKKKNHAGLIVVSPDPDRVKTLLETYTQRFYTDFHTSQPAPDRPTA